MLDGGDVFALAVGAQAMQGNARFSGLVNAYVAQGWTYEDARIKALADLGNYEAKRYVWRAEQAWRYTQQGFSRDRAFQAATRDMATRYPEIPFWHHWIAPTLLSLVMLVVLGVAWGATSHTVPANGYGGAVETSPWMVVFWAAMFIGVPIIFGVWSAQRKAWRRRTQLGTR